jgi:hypothetical protein
MIEDKAIHDKREGKVGHGTLTECSCFGRDIEHLRRYLDIFALLKARYLLEDDAK